MLRNAGSSPDKEQDEFLGAHKWQTDRELDALPAGSDRAKQTKALVKSMVTNSKTLMAVKDAEASEESGDPDSASERKLHHDQYADDSATRQLIPRADDFHLFGPPLINMTPGAQVVESGGGSRATKACLHQRSVSSLLSKSFVPMNCSSTGQIWFAVTKNARPVDNLVRSINHDECSSSGQSKPY